MISFENFIMDNNSPIYAQIVRYVKRGIVAGSIADGEELPSRRVLSATLGVNPNTIQKACRILEEEGIIQSHTGSKSFVAVDDQRVETIRRELMENDVGAVVSAMKQSGITKAEALALLEQLWQE